ncbi:MAG: hypothetical protein F6K37_29125 [Moorea sp. SIO4E2]|uniref:hypothetical protein n=1 Tax=Moorena sp. SIO4E2 TaxID=2607826 RepID=UPI0013BD9F41|nr:hypothetical protein [Moorena sp. SIO4E2]NEQ09857.1 hypothetical protein [Moorena sp. SIO4E2]
MPTLQFYNSQFFILHYFWYWWALPISLIGVQFCSLSAMPTLQLSQFSILHSTLFLVLVGIAHFIDRGSILIFLSNAHPTILATQFLILNSSFYIIFGIGGHCPFHGSAFNFDLYQQCPPYNSKF